jgi:hypothetical protein
LIYLGLITDRIPVLPVFTPSHIGGDKPPIAFGDVFDVPRLSKLLGKPVIEWRDVKDPKSDQVDDLGCWSVWASVQGDPNPRDSQVPIHTKLGANLLVKVCPTSCSTVLRYFVYQNSRMDQNGTGSERPARNILGSCKIRFPRDSCRTSRPSVPFSHASGFSSARRANALLRLPLLRVCTPGQPCRSRRYQFF